MFVVVYSPRDNEVIYARRMGPYEKMDLRKFADLVADMYESEIAEPNGDIPSCCGDIRVEFRPRKNVDWHIWSGQSYYFTRD